MSDQESDREAMDAGNFNYDDNTTTGNESINSGKKSCSNDEFISRLLTADDNITRDNELLNHLFQKDDSMAVISEKQVDYPSRIEQETSSLVDTRVESKNEDFVNQTLQTTHSEMEDKKKEIVFQKKLTGCDFTSTNGLRVPKQHFVQLKPRIRLPATLTLTDHQVGKEWEMEFKENSRKEIFLRKEIWSPYRESQELRVGDTIKIERIMKLKGGVQKTENIDWEESVDDDLVDIEYTITKIHAEEVSNED